jgi:hypothetical protein
MMRALQRAHQLCNQRSAWNCMQTQSEFREPTESERPLLDRLLEANFPDKDELAALLRSVRVKTIDEDGGLELRSGRR